MKLTELKCPACNAVLRLSEENPQIAVCDYCQTRYLVETEVGGGKILSQEGQRTWYTPREPQTSPEKKKTGWEPYGWKRVSTACLVAIVIITATRIPKLLKQQETVSDEPLIPKNEEVVVTEMVQEKRFEGVFAKLVEQVFGTRADRVPPEELAQFQWISVTVSRTSIRIGYSFENPYETPEAIIMYLEFDPAESIDYLDLTRFIGLKKLETNRTLPDGALQGLSVQGLSVPAESPKALAGLLEDPELVVELNIKGEVTSLEGLGTFQGLKELTISDGRALSSIRELSAVPKLETLTLQSCEQISDYEVLSVLKELKTLSLDSCALKNTNFLTSLSKLTKLSITDASLLRIAGLEEQKQLASLTLTRIKELRELPLTKLTGLTELVLEIPNTCTVPEFDGLSSLTRLAISGIEDTSFLRSLQNLTELELKSCGIGSSADFSKLTKVKTLKLKYLYGAVDQFSFLNYLTALETLDMQGYTGFEDITAVFTLPSVKTLLLDGVEGGLNFSKLKKNPMLSSLHMDGVKLYENIEISYEGAMTMVDYDKIILADHLDFLSHFPNLSELSLAENKLTELTALADLKQLERLDIRENYITDLSPLASLTKLREVICTGNVIDNYRVLEETVQIQK